MGLNQQKFFVDNIDNFLQGNYSIEKSNNEFTFKKCDVPIIDQEITDMSVIGVASEFPTDQI
ncbi:hypothetical protein [Rickettsia endosymbiont of Pantilius tunicatus]|uniref:hypothetical protein n=1 Tax=unclassified Rickettsia TaxID=114295 RepID=UPI0030E20116